MFAVVGNALTAAQPLCESRRDQLVGIESVEHVGGGPAGEGGADAGLLDGSLDAQPAVPLQAAFHPGNRMGDADIVEGAFLEEPCDGGVNLLRLVAFAREPLAHLRFGELAARDHLEAVQVSLMHQTG